MNDREAVHHHKSGVVSAREPRIACGSHAYLLRSVCQEKRWHVCGSVGVFPGFHCGLLELKTPQGLILQMWLQLHFPPPNLTWYKKPLLCFHLHCCSPRKATGQHRLNQKKKKEEEIYHRRVHLVTGCSRLDTQTHTFRSRNMRLCDNLQPIYITACLHWHTLLHSSGYMAADSRVQTSHRGPEQAECRRNEGLLGQKLAGLTLPCWVRWCSWLVPCLYARSIRLSRPCRSAQHGNPPAGCKRPSPPGGDAHRRMFSITQDPDRRVNLQGCVMRCEEDEDTDGCPCFFFLFSALRRRNGTKKRR